MQGAKLYAGRFSTSDTESELLEQFHSIESAGVDWSVDDFGVTRIEVTIKADGPYDAYGRINTHHGQRLAIYGAELYQPASGKIYAVEWLPGDLVKYTAYGPNWDMERDYITKFFDPTDDIETTVSYIASRIPTANGSTDNIVANATTIAGWNPDYPTGSYPTDAIKDMLKMSDSSSRIYDFRMIDEPLKGTSLFQFEPHYTYRDETAAADWIVKREDLSLLRLSRNIEDFTNIIRVWYGLIEGTSTGVTANTMTAAGASFIDDGVQPGDTITNVTKGGKTRIVSVDSQTQVTHEGWRPKLRGTVTSGSTTTLVDTEADFVTGGVQVGDIVRNIKDDATGAVSIVAATTLTIILGMSGGKSNDIDERYEITGPMVSGDDYSVKTSAQTKYAEHQIDKGGLWDNVNAVFERNMNATQAAQYAQELATVTPQQVQSFVVSSPYIEDGNGASHPLWDVITNGGGYIQISDLYPTASQFSDALNSLTTFFITSMSYDYKSNALTVDVDNLSRRLDARLRRAQILRVPQIRRY